MKNIMIAVLFLLAIRLFSQATLDPRYHTYDEIVVELNELQEEYPDIAKVVTIGETFTDHIPILALKISYNVDIDEDEPELLYAGQCHAEEVLGVEVVMYMINNILSHRYQAPYRYWIMGTEMWMVPTYNPEGLGVVMSGDDVTYRKNKRDNNNNGIFDFVPGQGRDIDGVDPNRNYAFNWVHGDTLYCPDGEEVYDYYRGPYPFSEAGTQAIKNLADNHPIMFSINWHSSRTGNHSEKLHYSFEWLGGKQCPDFVENQTIANHVAELIPNEEGTNHYEQSPSIGRTGLAHDWFYKEYGTFQYLIECGTSNIQPNAEIVDDTCERNAQGAYYLLDRAIGNGTDRNMLTGHITDSSNGSPIRAEITVVGKEASFFAPRLSDELYGRYYRILQPGTYTVKISKEGYTTQTIENVIINESLPTTLDIQLVPKAQVDLYGSIKAGSQYLNSTIYVKGDYPKTIECPDGTYHLTTYAGDQISFTVYSEGFYPKFYTNTYNEGGDQTVNFNLENSAVIYEDSFENGLADWEVNGEWYFTSDAQNGNTAITTTQNRFYQNNMDISITSPTFDTSTFSTPACIEFYHKYHTEHDTDICYVEICIETGDREELAHYSGVNDDWGKVFLPLPALDCEYTFNVRFRFHSDTTIDDPGWIIDNFKIINSTGVDTSDSVVQYNTALLQNYPNPFSLSKNSKNSTKIEYNLKNDGNTKISIYNLKGRKVTTLFNNFQKAGKYTIDWNGKDNSGKSVRSGVYFYKLSTPHKNIVKKMIVLK